MKKIHLLGLTVLLVLSGANSCIFEAPGDRFYRTLWNSTQVPLGPLDIEELTLEFLCGERVTVKDGSGTIIAHGTYSPDGNIAVLCEVTAVIDETTVSFMEAHRNGDTLFLLWRPDGMLTPFTTAMERRSSYE
ncbi:MAG: hypothetical protein J6R30_07170 [Bacteroidales bacterium]|nr:hypothetical protein [Bacteroidales bacterium]